jgi:hypothetical protein
MCTLPFAQRDKPRSAKDLKSTKTDVPFDMKVIDVYTPRDIRTFRQRRDEDVDIAMCYDWLRIRNLFERR